MSCVAPCSDCCGAGFAASMPVLIYPSVLWCELMAALAMRKQCLPYCANSPFRSAVAHVVSPISKKQVFRVYTNSVVALVKYPQSVWYRPINQLPREPVCPFTLSTFFKQMGKKCSVTIAANGAFPLPATRRRRLINLLPEPISDWFHCSLHLQSPLTLCRAPCLPPYQRYIAQRAVRMSL